MSGLARYGLSMNPDDVEKLLSLPTNTLDSNIFQPIVLKNIIDIK